ncbi:hypothetical protein CSPX01_16886, partial [Colletotrichum filicis]
LCTNTCKTRACHGSWQTTSANWILTSWLLSHWSRLVSKTQCSQLAAPSWGRAGLSASRTGIADVPHMLPGKDHGDRRRIIGDEKGSAKPAVEENPAKLLEAVDNGYVTADECSMRTSWWFGHKVTKGAGRDSCYGAETNEV